MMYTVFLLEDAVKDIEAIYQYIRKSGNKTAARAMIKSIREACGKLKYLSPISYLLILPYTLHLLP